MRDQLVPGTGHTSGPEHRLHAGLVAYVERGLHVHAVETQHLARVRHGHLQLLEGADQALDMTHLLAQAAYGLDYLLRVERVVGSPVPGEKLLQVGRKSFDRLSSDDADADVRQRGRRSDEPRCCREKEGATKAATTMRGTLLVAALGWAPTSMLKFPTSAEFSSSDVGPAVKLPTGAGFDGQAPHAISERVAAGE